MELWGKPKINLKIPLRGWDIKTKFNGYKNANFLSGSGYLENLAVEVIKRIQDGEKQKKNWMSLPHIILTDCV